MLFLANDFQKWIGTRTKIMRKASKQIISCKSKIKMKNNILKKMQKIFFSPLLVSNDLALFLSSIHPLRSNWVFFCFIVCLISYLGVLWSFSDADLCTEKLFVVVVIVDDGVVIVVIVGVDNDDDDVVVVAAQLLFTSINVAGKTGQECAFILLRNSKYFW